MSIQWGHRARTDLKYGHGFSGIADRASDWLFGGGSKALVPPDMQGLRQQNIDLLRSFLTPGAFKNGGAGATFFGLPSTDAISPETATYDKLHPLLEAMLTGTGPQFERDIAMGNQQGGRFSSANAIMRGEAYRNLFNMRGQTANALTTLSQAAGASQRDALNQRLQLLSGLFGMGAQTSFGFPVTQNHGIIGDLAPLFAFAASSGA